MKTSVAFLRAFARAYTYDIQRNSYLWLGVFWGMVIPLFILAFEVSLLSGGGGGPLEVLRTHPAYLYLIGHPLILGALFGAMGTVRHDLEIENGLLMKRLEQLAMTDPLTGLYNRRYIKEALKNMLDTARRSEKPLSVILIDLDGFKAVEERTASIRAESP